MIRQLLSFFLLALIIPNGNNPPTSEPLARIDPANITIARDAYGMPHIFAPTDAEVAYGLAWANAEDAFDLMQELFLTTNGFMGRVKGAEGARSDFYVHAIGAEELVARAYETLRPAYKRYLDGFCQGLNAYAAAHPDEVLLKKAYPIRPEQIVQGYVVAFSALCGVAGAVSNAVGGKLDTKKPERGLGSNAFAVGSTRTADGNTYFCTNPHFKLDGPYSFYEVHLHSEEGLNVLGAIFQGGTSVFLGSNPNLGWGQTWNYFDQADTYNLEMHPKKKLWYKFDGQWIKLEKRPIWLKVNLAKWLRIPVRKTAYWSKYGPTLKSKSGQFIAVRALSAMTIGAGQQYYYMNKASDFSEFRSALDLQGVPKFNLVYADKEDNLFYIHNGLFPHRSEGYDWEKPVPGNTSRTLWTKAYTIDELPQVKNPSCGYLFNTNNSPFNATCASENDDSTAYPKYLDLRSGGNNRSGRLEELIEGNPSISFEDFKSMKFDYTFPANSKFKESLAPLYALNPGDHPALAGTIRLLHAWDLVASPESENATAFALTLDYIFNKKGYGDEAFVKGVDADSALCIEAVAHAQKHLMAHFGTLSVPLKDFQRFVRDGKDYPVSGFPDALMANYAEPYKDGKYKLMYGDSYTHLVSFSKDGAERIETLLPFFPYKDAERYHNQLEMYNRLETKSMTFSKEEVLESALKVYQPE